jgi:tRNA 2-thiouridine synthesizing protein E
MQALDIARQARTAGPDAIFDEDGFLLDQAHWSEHVGRAIAEQEGVGPLTDKHWRVINFIRERYHELGALPNMRRVCRATEIPKAQVYALFGGCRAIWRIAGLPNPGEEAKAYLI